MTTIPRRRKRKQHIIGEAAFERRHGIHMKAMAENLWLISDAGKRYRARAEEKNNG